MSDVPAVKRERCSLGLDRSSYGRVIAVEDHISGHLSLPKSHPETNEYKGVIFAKQSSMRGQASD